MLRLEGTGLERDCSVCCERRWILLIKQDAEDRMSRLQMVTNEAKYNNFIACLMMLYV